ncbi:MAG TPA: [acyl-carrier-protein] S-malonyltransferase [Parachlamydiales bacterium]|nr:[acyl-carrier-protein] S-malonyltransferase [Parachlamydiales bacterium]
MTKKRAFLFPGQGAQAVGMAKDFYDHFLLARETFEEAEEIPSRNLSKVIFEGPFEELVRTDNCQLAIYLASVAIGRVIRQQLPEVLPSFCAGLSLGEYAALTLSDKLCFASAVPLVEARATFMQEACEKSPGAMLAVLGQNVDELEALLKESAAPQKVWIANLNCPQQVVLAGSREGIERMQEFLLGRGVKRLRLLDVGGAFHTPLMESARRKLSPLIQKVSLRESPIALVMNATGEEVSSLFEMRALMIQQVTSPVFWEKGIRKMEERGVEEYIEIGPGTTLTGLNRRIGVAGTTLNVEKVEDLEKLGAEVYERTLKG